MAQGPAPSREPQIFTSFHSWSEPFRNALPPNPSLLNVGWRGEFTPPWRSPSPVKSQLENNALAASLVFGNKSQTWFALFNLQSSFLFFFFIFVYLFLVVLGLLYSSRAFSSCGEWGQFFTRVQGLLIAMTSLVAKQGLWSVATVAVAHRVSCPKACGIFLNQGSHPPHGQADFIHCGTKEVLQSSFKYPCLICSSSACRCVQGDRLKVS